MFDRLIKELFERRTSSGSDHGQQERSGKPSCRVYLPRCHLHRTTSCASACILLNYSVMLVLKHGFVSEVMNASDGIEQSFAMFGPNSGVKLVNSHPPPLLVP